MKLKDYTGGAEENRIRLLLVDDEPAFLEQTELFLEREHDRLDIDSVSSASDALGLLENHSHDCVVSDYQMPEMDGLEFLRTVREERGQRHPFHNLHRKGREEVAMEARDLGANRYLQKGGDPESQYRALARIVFQEVQSRMTPGAAKAGEIT